MESPKTNKLIICIYIDIIIHLYLIDNIFNLLIKESKFNVK